MRTASMWNGYECHVTFTAKLTFPPRCRLAPQYDVWRPRSFLSLPSCRVRGRFDVSSPTDDDEWGEDNNNNKKNFRFSRRVFYKLQIQICSHPQWKEWNFRYHFVTLARWPLLLSPVVWMRSKLHWRGIELAKAVVSHVSFVPLTQGATVGSVWRSRGVRWNANRPINDSSSSGLSRNLGYRIQRYYISMIDQCEINKGKERLRGVHAHTTPKRRR